MQQQMCYQYCQGDNCILTLRDECVYNKNPKFFFFAFQFLLTMPVEV